MPAYCVSISPPDTQRSDSVDWADPADTSYNKSKLTPVVVQMLYLVIKLPLWTKSLHRIAKQ